MGPYNSMGLLSLDPPGPPVVNISSSRAPPRGLPVALKFYGDYVWPPFTHTPSAPVVEALVGKKEC